VFRGGNLLYIEGKIPGEIRRENLRHKKLITLERPSPQATTEAT
jgi:hypothetical protein